MTRRVCWTVVVLSLAAGAASAQTAQVQVSYDVTFSTNAALFEAPGSNACPGAGGTDELTGTLVGMEPAPVSEDNMYEGLLTRTTNFTTCSVATRPNGEHYECTLHIRGTARVWVKFEVYTDGRGSYLMARKDNNLRVLSSSVTGTCDQAEMVELQNEYGEMSTAGSPDGQHINMAAFPLSGPYPITFSPLGPAQQQAWTLIVRGRRP